jgi:hypothetical protein
MNVKELREALDELPDDTEVLANWTGEYEVHEIINVTAETNMLTGGLALILCGDPMPISDNARDFEPHPAYESTINAWIFD